MGVVEDFYKAKKEGGEKYVAAMQAALSAGYIYHEGHLSAPACALREDKPDAKFLQGKPLSDGTTADVAKDKEAWRAAKLKQERGE